MIKTSFGKKWINIYRVLTYVSRYLIVLPISKKKFQKDVKVAAFGKVYKYSVFENMYCHQDNFALK